MSIIDTLVTDRTGDDVQEARSIIERIINGTATEADYDKYADFLKGCYTVLDMNRVGEAVAYIGQRLSAAGYSAPVDPKTDWTETDKLYASDAKTYIENIKIIRNALRIQRSLPEIPNSLENLDYNGANRIELLLKTVDELLTKIESTINFSWTIGLADTGIYFGG